MPILMNIQFLEHKQKSIMSTKLNKVLFTTCTVFIMDIITSKLKQK